MIDATLPSTEPVRLPRAHRLGNVGDRGMWLFAGPGADLGPESLTAHLVRVGRIEPFERADEYRAVLRESGLRGRGGGGFPLAAKLETARLAPGEPIVVINASESEPASHKDRTLATFRPHLLLDGAAVIAATTGCPTVSVHLHRGAAAPAASLRGAIAERRATGLADPRWELSFGPDRYVSGEASAIASLHAGGEARPVFSSVPMAHRGPSGRPTVVSNAETAAQAALLVRSGAQAWRAAGTPSSPGPQLITLTGGVPYPGQVVEVVGTATIGDVLLAVGYRQPPAGVLVGGYAGTWVTGWSAWSTLLDRDDLGRVGAGPGCGLLGVLPEGHCAVAETARLVAYLADETAGQCGPCVQGLPRLAASCRALAEGSLRRRGFHQMRALADLVDGGGACSHPDGVVRLIRSLLLQFEVDVADHLRGAPCAGASREAVFPLPGGALSDREWQ
jgi:NADH:ubiquinone oxidoreductase subunit F (NADH-binding)